MTPIKSYMANALVGKHLHFKCECLMNIDVVGVVKGWSQYHDEIIWDICTDDGKIISIGENHPNMNVEEI